MRTQVMDYKTKEGQYDMITKLKELLYKELLKQKQIVFVCIGTPKADIDLVGPAVGTILEEKFKDENNVHVYGTIEDPIHALNIYEKTRDINKKHNNDNSLIIGIDAAVTRNTLSLGTVQFAKRGIMAGAGAGKDLPCVGTHSIIGLTAVMDENKSYRSTEKNEKDLKKEEIIELSKEISATILRAKRASFGEYDRYIRREQIKDMFMFKSYKRKEANNG